ncbi:hypothetical protein PV08_07649 [Exophiala spinifera]|uniref:Uncharacterized protein n=1 Tax=Exophiala spinifera TaxID=91928 RepID=A0A0D2BUB2_9EURO|nr:uncharacterized protein PV08_07649 [Exophiala spinifera]KIW14864.1 hypothetical protein PV08_07649 [Exophiala spinifera]
MAAQTIHIVGSKSIERQASPAFYSQNEFTISDPTLALAISSTSHHLGPPWCKLFRRLAADGVGLRQIYVYWDSETTFGHFGGGADVEVVRALAEIRGLQKLEIDGFFAKEWPAYLQGKTGLTVWSPHGKKAWYYQELRKFQRNTPDLAP